jgi:hypothetical protein
MEMLGNCEKCNKTFHPNFLSHIFDPYAMVICGVCRNKIQKIVNDSPEEIPVRDVIKTWLKEPAR